VRTARTRSRSDDPDWPAPRPAGTREGPPLGSGSGVATDADPVRNGS
jgi:hypothetical protein